MRVITADDLHITQHELKQRFTELGWEVIAHAFNGRDAIALCEEYHPDLVVLDISMPPINGDEAGRIIHERNLAAKLIFATSQGQQHAIDLAKTLGASIIRKPYTKIKIVQALQALGFESTESVAS